MKIAVFTVFVVLLINTIISGNAQAGLKTIDELRNELVDYKFEYATYIPDVEKMPILSVRLMDAEMKNEGEIEGYPSIINMDYEKYGLNEEGSKGTYPETTYDNVLMYDYTNKFGQIFASGQPSAAEEIILKGKQEIRNLGGGNTDGIPAFVTIQSPWRHYNTATEKYGDYFSCNQLTGIGGYFISYYPVLSGVPVISSIGLAFKESASSSRDIRRVMEERSEYIYCYYLEDFWSLSGLGIWEEIRVENPDMLLCSYEMIEKTIKKAIQNGLIDTVNSAILGYVIYMDKNVDYSSAKNVRQEDYLAVPTWCISVKYSGEYNNNGKMMINAQTGEAYQYYSKKIDDWYAPEYMAH